MAITYTNLSSLNTVNHLNRTADLYDRAAEKIASGNRLSRASEDPSALAISAGLDSNVVSLQAAQRNALDASSLFEAGETGLSQIGDMLIRMRELALTGSNDWMRDEDRTALNIEYSQLKEEIDRTAQSTNFRGLHLLTGQGGEIQVGTGNSENDRLTFELGNSTAGALGVDDLDLNSAGGSQDSLDTIDSALNKVEKIRAQNGALQARAISIGNAQQNHADTLNEMSSRIRDTDIAKEASELAKHKIMQDSQVAVLAQSNSNHSSILNLLQGK